MKNYHSLIHKILLEGVKTKDRTGVGTKSIFGTRLEWDLTKGFPAITTKSLAWNAVVGELLWFLSGSSNVEELRERTHGPDSGKFTIWDANYEEQGKALGYTNGDLGPVYGHQFRSSPYYPTETVIEVIPRLFKQSEAEQRNPVLVTPDTGFGEVFCTNNCGKIITLNKVSEKGAKNSVYNCQFLETGSLGVFSRPNLRNGNAKDPLISLSRMDIRKDCEVPERLYNLWYNMCSRCLDVEAKMYPLYGGAGVELCNSWKILSNFAREIGSVPGYYTWLSNTKYELDKDYFGANAYSKSTCIFIPSSYNKNIAKVPSNMYYDIRHKNTSKRKEVIFLKPFSAENNLPNETIRSHLLTNTFWENEDFFIEKVFSEKLVRYKMYTDQTEELIQNIRNGVSSGVHSRRNMVTAWDVAQLPDMALPPCHHTFQVYVTPSNELSLMWHQR